MFTGFIKKRKLKKEKDVKEINISDSLVENTILQKEDAIIKSGEKKSQRITTDKKPLTDYREIQRIQDKVKLKGNIREQDQETSLLSSNFNHDESLIVPLKIKEKIERIILKILYDQKTVKSLKDLTEKALDRAANERITISEKSINLIIHQMNKDEKIQFTQKDGWKIRI